MENEGFYKCEANYVPLSPISFIERAAFVYEKSPSIIYDNMTYTWKETYDRCVKLASALSNFGVNRGTTVSFASLYITPYCFMVSVLFISYNILFLYKFPITKIQLLHE